MNSLLDFFLFVSRDLKTDYGKTRNRYRLVSGALTVGLDVTIDKMDIHEAIEIEKKWDPALRECLIYTMDYEEPHIFETHERERMKTLPGGDWCYKAHLKMEGSDRYLSNEMFVDNMPILSPSKCMLSYESTRLSRGLRSLAQLKMPPHTTDVQAKNEVFPFLFAEMLKTGEGLLINQLGEDRPKWITALRKGKADIAIPFKGIIEGVYPVWIVGRCLVDLCRVYARPTVN